MLSRSPMQSLRNEAVCTICQDYFKDPVSISCGHNFCRGCVTLLWGREDEQHQNQPPARDSVRQQVMYQQHVSNRNRGHAGPRVRGGHRRHSGTMDTEQGDEEDTQNNSQARFTSVPRSIAVPEHHRYQHNRQQYDDDDGGHHYGYIHHYHEQRQLSQHPGRGHQLEFHQPGHLSQQRDPVPHHQGSHQIRRERAHRPQYPDTRRRSPPRPKRVFTCPQCLKTFPRHSFRTNFQLASMVEIIQEMFPVPPGKDQKICSKHEESLTFFCEVDQKAICVVCRESKHHKHHNIVPVDEGFWEDQNKKKENPVAPHSPSDVPDLRS